MNSNNSGSSFNNIRSIPSLRSLLLSKRLRGLLVSLACTLFFAGLVAVMDFRETNRLLFIVDMEASASGLSKVYYDVGNGYNESDSYTKTVCGNMQRRTFLLMPSKSIRSIRLNPINVTAVVKIKDARVEDNQGHVIKRFSNSDFRPIQQIDKTDIRDGILTIHTAENATEPTLLLENSAIGNHISWSGYMVKRGWTIFGYGLIILLFLSALFHFAGIAARNRHILIGVGRLKTYITVNPKKSIALIGLIAAVTSCYPVVFFGKSFVSPALSGLPLLYENPPFIPGFPPEAVVENVRSADVAATFWSIAPDTAVQYDALVKHFEFPFWNRYAGGGLPLFAQGQSMIGDILHWIPISLGGSSVGWDIKFVLSKAIFAIGMGLLVFRMTRHLWASSLVAISSCFLGFFAYRFSHPAFFVLPYAPWLVLQWDSLGELLSKAHPQIKNCVIQGFLLAGVTWLQLNAGAPKEGVITACFMHTLGMILFINHVRIKTGLIKSIFISIGFGLAIVMISAPYWLLFLDALSKSFTAYDIPGVNIYPLWKIVGFFDNLFFQHIDGTLGAPSTNIFVLLCLTSAILSLRLHKSVQFYGTMILFFLALSTAYGLVPKCILISIPFINKIQHIFNTFSMPMMIFALVLSGYGIQYYLETSAKRKKEVIVLFLSVFIGMTVVYLLFLSLLQIPVVYGGKAIWLILPFAAAAFLAGWVLYRQSGTGIWDKRTLLILACCFILLHVRHGMHLMTGNKSVDFFIMNPTQRADFSNKSESIEFVKSKIKGKMMPLRVIGEGSVLFPGYNSMVGLEGIKSLEALRNGYFEKLLNIVDYSGSGWMRLIKSDQIAACSAALDLFNIGYIVTAPGTQVPRGVKLIHSSDLDVWERESVWPRAFLVNQVLEVRKSEDIAEALSKNPNIPFAAVESQLIPQGMQRSGNDLFKMIPARQYELTNNSTNFSVDATGSGIIVLSETYYPGDFVASLNGKKVDYVRVNHAFKGIWVKEAGKYDVSFTYRPERLNQAIIISLCGTFLLLFLCITSGLKHLKYQN